MKNIREVEWEKIKLTVVMPSYNRGRYIRQAVDSVLSQKCSFRFLLAITDDASTDGTQAVIAEYEEKYPDKILVMFSDQNCGLLANDIKVFSYMKSDYFCVLDPDDYWIDTDFLEKAVSFLERNPDYVAWGANTEIMRNEERRGELYINAGCKERTSDGIEDYLSGQAVVTHTTASVYRNAIFKNGVPDIIRDAVGTLSEASFRGDMDRYVIHLKYGKAKFVNECVGVYRIHDQGICQGGTMFHWMLMNARAELDYSDYYDGIYEEQFRKKAKRHFKKACVEVYKAAAGDAYFHMSEYDKENFSILMNCLCGDTENGAKRKHDFDYRREERKVSRLLANPEGKKVIFWGTGNSAKRLLEEYYLFGDKITCFTDGNEEKCKAPFLGKKVISPHELRKYKEIYLVIGSMYFQEIMDRIIKEHLCVPENVINLYWYDAYVKNME